MVDWQRRFWNEQVAPTAVDVLYDRIGWLFGSDGSGDPGGRFTTRTTEPFDQFGATPGEAGAHAVSSALGDTANGDPQRIGFNHAAGMTLDRHVVRDCNSRPIADIREH